MQIRGLIDLNGKQFGRWTVIELTGKKNQEYYWKCRCECGTEREVAGSSLRKGKSKSCGCLTREKSSERMKAINEQKTFKSSGGQDLTGQRFGRWTVLNLCEKTGRERYWRCQCDCGTIKDVMGRNLKNGKSTSCGCYKKERNTQLISSLNQQRALDLTGQKYGLLTPIEPTNERSGGSVVWKCQCDCGNITYVSVSGLRGSRPIRSCGCQHRSFGEQEIIKILENNEIQYEEQYTFPDLKNKRYDFFLPTEQRLIEFDGEQHYKNVLNWDKVEIQQKRDKEKNEYALSHNIPLVRIPYWERDNITLEMLMGDQYLVKGN